MIPCCKGGTLSVTCPSPQILHTANCTARPHQILSTVHFILRKSANKNQKINTESVDRSYIVDHRNNKPSYCALNFCPMSCRAVMDPPEILLSPRCDKQPHLSCSPCHPLSLWFSACGSSDGRSISGCHTYILGQRKSSMPSEFAHINSFLRSPLCNFYFCL